MHGFDGLAAQVLRTARTVNRAPIMIASATSRYHGFNDHQTYLLWSAVVRLSKTH